MPSGLEKLHQPIDDQPRGDRFLICGLGSLGQHCVAVLRNFDVSISAIDIQPSDWEIPDLPELIDTLVVGDCRQETVLEQAQIRQCRAILLVTSNERVNAEVAFTARSLNPQIRLIVRSAKENLNQLLEQELGNYIAFDPTQLPASAFAIAAQGTGTLGFFQLDGQWLRVRECQLQPGDQLCHKYLHEVKSKTLLLKRCVLAHTPAGSAPAEQFYQWEPDTRLQVSDTLITVESTELFTMSPKTAKNAKRRRRKFLAERPNLTLSNVEQKLIQFWQTSSQRDRRLAVLLVIGAVVLLALAINTLLFCLFYQPPITWDHALNATVILLLGGYSTYFSNLTQSGAVPWGVQLFGLVLNLVGTAAVAVLYALLTETLLSARFQFLKRRPPVPQRDHTVVVGLGRVGQRVAALLQEFRQPLVGINTTELEQNVLPQLPLIVGNITKGLEKVNLETAKSVVVVTDDEMVNVEVALMARAANPRASLVVRTYEQRLTDRLAQLLPGSQVLCAYALAAEVFTAAAFGENVKSLFRLNQQTVLVTEYQIESGDRLNGYLLAEVAYGYGVVPVLHQKPPEPAELMPSDTTRLALGDRLVVLATINSLKRIEHGKMAPRRWLVKVSKPLVQVEYEGPKVIAHVSGCNLSIAHDLMANLPGTLKVPLYKHQAQRLVRDLSKLGVQAHLVAVSSHAVK